MLQIHYANPTGLFSYSSSEGVYFRDGQLINLIGVNEDTGGSNGAGKSSLFNSICELLFGENPTGVNGPGVVNNVWGRGCCGRLEFTSWEGVRYRITLCRDWKTQYYAPDNEVSYTGTGLFLDKQEGDVWVDFRGSGMPDTRKRILNIVGISYTRFLSIAYMSYRVGNSFLRGTNKDRMDILSGITGVEEWDSIRDKCRGKKKEFQNESAAIGEKLSYERGILAGFQNQLEELGKTDWVKSKKDYEEALVRLKREESEYSAELVKIRKEHITAKESLYSFDTNKYSNRINENKLKMVELKSCVVLRTVDPALDKKLREANQNIDLIRGQMSMFESGDGALLELAKCPTCDSNITKTKKAKIQARIKVLSDKKEAFVQESDFISREIDKVEDEQKKEQEALDLKRQQEISKLEASNEKYNHDNHEYLKEYTIAKSKLDQAEGIIIEYEKNLSDVQASIKNIPQWIVVCDNNIDTMEGLGTKIEGKNDNINILIASAEEIFNQLNIANWLIHNIPFIKLHKLSVSMSVLSDHINNYLSEMGETIRVDVRAFSEKKSKVSAGDFTDLLKGEVHVEITDGEKNINSRLYSDGEIGKISNAFVRSLREVALSFGCGCNILMLDEVFSFIDYYSSQRLADSFVNKSKGTTIITDNSERAGNLMEFDEVWTARKRSDLTMLEVN